MELLTNREDLVEADETEVCRTCPGSAIQSMYHSRICLERRIIERCSLITR